MSPERLKALLEDVATGALPVEQAMQRLEQFPYEDLGYARVDHHRHLRLGAPEVIFGAGKSAEQIVSIAERLLAQCANVLVTRTNREVYEELRSRFEDARFHEAARAITVVRQPAPTAGVVAVVTAGTTDIGVAEEAAVTAETCGSRVERLFDVGVAGLHRLLGQRERLQEANVVVVVAGMEGALPSVVAGLVAAPVIAVPTSIGYGASFQGLAALLGMLNSCASNVVVVNIDNGFGAGFFAALVDRRIEAKRGVR